VGLVFLGILSLIDFSVSDKKKLPFRQLLKAWAEPYRMLAGFMYPYRRRFFIGVAFGAGFALLTASLAPILYLVATQIFRAGGATPLRLPPFLANLQLPEWMSLHPGLPGVIAACVVIPSVMLVRSLFSYGNSYFMAWVALRMLSDLRSAVFAHVASQSMDYFNQARSGKLMSRITNDTRVAQNAFTSVASDIFRDPIAVVAGVAVLFLLDWKFCLAMLFLFPVCLVPIAIFGRKVRQAGKAEENEAGAMSVILHETLAGIRVIKSFAREKYQADQFAKSSLEQFKISLKVRKSADMAQPLIETISAFGIALALLYVFFFNVDPLKIVALLGGTFVLYEPMKKISRIHMLLQKALAASTNIFEILQTKATIQDAPDAVAITGCQGRIEFDSVTFSYGNNQNAVSDISLTIEPGKQYALVGASGAGKSSMLSLLLRFYEPQSGAIRLDGRDLRQITQKSLREHVGIVTQDTFLFHDSIFENIRYGRLDATREEIEAAAKLAFAHDFILAQPLGYETVIGDKGCLLSGGQQQRISIARALLKNAPVLLLDEATSALDSESERMIQSALERLSQGKTVIAIAHRLSTILKSDQIVVMDQGRIIEIGTHSHLMECSTVYRRLYELQFHHESDAVAV